MARPGSPGLTGEPAVRLEGIVQRFPGVLALDAVDFDLAPGEIHALLGENGAGKTTLIRLLGGLVRPDEGRIVVRGRPVRIPSPRAARRLGIGMVHQRFHLSEKHTVLQNLLLATPGLPFFLSRRTGREEAAATLARLAIELDLDGPVWQLGVGQRQRLEIAKAIHAGATILVLDEPTAVLAPEETPEFFEVLRGMRRSGLSIVFISHKLEEVLAIADRVTVLRHGKWVSTDPAAECDRATLARRMIGSDLPAAPPRSGSPGDVVLEAVGLVAKADRGGFAVRGVDLAVRAGEIHGVAGVTGNGQVELVETIAGLRPIESGRLAIGGRPCRPWDPALAIERGVRHIPADRHGMGCAPRLSVAENLVLKDQRSPRFARFGFLRRGAVRAHAEDRIAAFDVSPRSPSAPAGTLSGGNLQKVIAARETDAAPSVLVAAYPTRGLDVGAASALHAVIRRERDRGAAVLLVSEELAELIDLCDRISVLYEGRVVLSGPTDSLSPAELGRALSGGRRGYTTRLARPGA